MSAKRFEIILIFLLVFGLGRTASAESARALVNQANKLYSQGKFNDAINKYEQTITENPDLQEPKFNKANSYYRLDDLENAVSAYEDVAAKSKDMKLVAKAKYNLGNSCFQRGSKQKDSDLQKAIDDFKTSIGFWRSVLDIEPDNEKAAKNIEVARLVIKDLLDQLNKQKQNEPNQPRDPNQSQQQQQEQNKQQDSQNGQQNQQQQKSQQQEPNKPPDANQPKQQPEQKEQKQQQKMEKPETTAQEILDKEQKQRQERQMMQRGQYQKVDKDW